MPAERSTSAPHRPGIASIASTAAPTRRRRWVLMAGYLVGGWRNPFTPVWNRALFTEAKRLAMGFCLGYAELANENGRVRRFNTSILVESNGAVGLLQGGGVVAGLECHLRR